jgi:beta-phosphoglucomutase-like phosphatase (HAD superfamily)
MPTLIFDCDGVLADTEQFGLDVFAENTVGEESLEHAREERKNVDLKRHD